MAGLLAIARYGRLLGNFTNWWGDFNHEEAVFSNVPDETYSGRFTHGYPWQVEIPELKAQRRHDPPKQIDKPIKPVRRKLPIGIHPVVIPGEKKASLTRGRRGPPTPFKHMPTYYATPNQGDRRYYNQTGRVPHKRWYRKQMAPRRVYRRVANARTGGFQHVEKKFETFEFDGSIGTTVAGSESSPTTEGSLTSIAAGDGPTHRDGRHIKVVGIYIRGQVLFAADAADAAQPLGDYVRLLVILDTQTNGSTFNAEDVLADTTDTDLDTLAFRNLEYIQRFRILKDIYVKRPYMAMTGTVGTPSYAASGVMVPFKINLPFKTPLQVNFTNTTAVIGNCVDNSVHVIAIACRDSNNLRYVARTRFIG